MSMSPQETRAVLALSLLASFADGDKHEREREQIKRVACGKHPLMSALLM